MIDMEDTEMLEKQTYHWLVIREKKNRASDKLTKETHDKFRRFAKEFSMDNYTLALDKLLDAFEKTLRFESIEDRLSALELCLEAFNIKQAEKEIKQESKESNTF
jgi:hypothetical protein